MRNASPIVCWLGAEGTDVSVSDGTVSFSCGPTTDWFRDPRSGDVTANAPVAVIAEGVPLTVSCVVRPELVAMFDAAALFVHYDERHWIKLALERSPAGEATIVSVRTAGTSDDNNHHPLPTPTNRLRITMDERSIALHVAPADDPVPTWKLVRYSAHPGTGTPTVGLLVQSPTGAGTTATFDSIVIERSAVAELRDGS